MIRQPLTHLLLVYGYLLPVHLIHESLILLWRHEHPSLVSRRGQLSWEWWDLIFIFLQQSAIIEIFPTTVWTHVSRILRSTIIRTRINKSDLHRDQFHITGKCITTMYLLKLVYCIKPNFLTWTVSSGDDFIEEDISCYCHQTRVIMRNRFWLSWLENIEHINNCSRLREESVFVDIELIDSNGIIWRMTKLILAPFKMFRTFLIQTIGPNHSLTVF